MNRVKNGVILIILLSFLCFVSIIPVTCIIKRVTGIYCPACGLTRSIEAILHFHFLDSVWYNILGIPLFIIIVFSVIIIIKEFIQNKFSYIPKILNYLDKYYIFILVLLSISFVFNNLKW